MKRAIEELDLTGTRACAAFNLKRAARAVVQVYDAELASVGLRSTQFAILVAAARSGAVSVSKLAELIATDQTTMTRGLKVLAREGLIAIGARGAGRGKLVTLTDAGVHALKKALPVWRDMQARFTSAFGAEKWHAMRLELVRAAALDGYRR